MDDQPGNHRDWSSLPTDLLLLVLQRLKNTETDCRRLRAVCTSWRSDLRSLRAPLQFPLKVILPMEVAQAEVASSFKHHGLLRQSIFYLNSLLRVILPMEVAQTEVASSVKHYGLLRQSTFYLISPLRESSSAGVWLTRVEETSHASDSTLWKLQNPMSAVCDFKELPELKAKVNFLDYRISEVARSYHLSGGRISPSSGKTAVLFLPKSEDSCDGSFLLLTLASLTHNTNLLLFNSETEKWVKFPEVCHMVKDIIAYEGKFYATYLRDDLIVIDPVTFEVKQLIKSEYEKVPLEMHTYLLESCGRLYLVQKLLSVDQNIYFYDVELDGADYNYLEEPLDLKVFVLSYSYLSNGDISHYWEPITSLGNRVFFVSSYVSFSLTAQELAWDEGNCIFFTQEQFRGLGFLDMFDNDPILFGSKEEYCGRISKYFGVYNLKDGSTITADDLSSQYTKIFWPVPSWFACLAAT